MSGSADAAAAAAASGGKGMYDRTKMSKVHEELWSRCDGTKLMTDSVTRRSKDRSVSHLTVMGDYLGVRRSVPCGPEQQNLIIAGDDGEALNGHVAMDDTGVMSVADTGTMFPYTTHGSTIN